MNIPGTTEANWRWRVTEDQITDERIPAQLIDLNRRHARMQGGPVS
jgi:4-alpha-glucanotransferase